MINPNDARPALSFTLLHELVHLLLGQSGISAVPADNLIERFCDTVAGDFLLPVQDLDKLDWDGMLDVSVLSERISGFAKERKCEPQYGCP